ncbi:MAG: nucleoside deaminase [Desulfobacterales bacterium]|nr:nucleoside deaminase [Desulfobacterales bacterium]
MKEEQQRFMAAALAEAEQALLAGEFPVGCVLARDGVILARGRRINSTPATVNELDHAEIVALRKLAVKYPGMDLAGVTAYSTMEPCLMCYAALILNGVRTIVYAYEDVLGGGTGLDPAGLGPLYREMAVTLVPGVLRHESLSLFKRFFASPDNAYRQKSPLAGYTLALGEKEAHQQ